jgi:hypothetical protein
MARSEKTERFKPYLGDLSGSDIMLWRQIDVRWRRLVNHGLGVLERDAGSVTKDY